MLEEGQPTPATDFRKRAESTDFLRLNDLLARRPDAVAAQDPPPLPPPAARPEGPDLEPCWHEQASAALAEVEPNLPPASAPLEDGPAPAMPARPPAYEPAGWLLADDEPRAEAPGSLASLRPVASPGPVALAQAVGAPDRGFASLADLAPAAPLSSQPAVDASLAPPEAAPVEDGIEEVDLDPAPPPVAAEDGWLLDLDDHAVDRGLGPVVPGTTRDASATPVTLEASYCEPEPRSRSLSRVLTPAFAAVTVLAGGLGLLGFLAAGDDAAAGLTPVRIEARSQSSVRLSPWEAPPGTRTDGATDPAFEATGAARQPVGRARARARVAEPGELEPGRRAARASLQPDARDGASPTHLRLALAEASFHRDGHASAARGSSALQSGGFFDELFRDAETPAQEIPTPSAGSPADAPASEEEPIVWAPLEDGADSASDLFEEGLFAGPPTSQAREVTPLASERPATVDYLDELFPDAQERWSAPAAERWAEAAPVPPPAAPPVAQQSSESLFEDGLFGWEPVEIPPAAPPVAELGADSLFADGLFGRDVLDPTPAVPDVEPRAIARAPTVDYLDELFPDAERRWTAPARELVAEASPVEVSPAPLEELDAESLFEDGLFEWELAAPELATRDAEPLQTEREPTPDYLTELFPDAEEGWMPPAEELVAETEPMALPEETSPEELAPAPSVAFESEPTPQPELVAEAVPFEVQEAAPFETPEVAPFEAPTEAPVPEVALLTPVGEESAATPPASGDDALSEPTLDAPVAVLEAPLDAPAPAPVLDFPPADAPPIDAPPVRTARVDEGPVAPATSSADPVAEAGPIERSSAPWRTDVEPEDAEEPTHRSGVRASLEPDFDPARVRTEARGEPLPGDEVVATPPTGSEVTPATDGPTHEIEVAGIQRRHADKDHWDGENIPLDLLSGPKRILTPNVGDVRVVYDDGTVFRGKLFGLGMNIVWVETNLGRMTLEGKRIVRVERERKREGDTEEAAPMRVRVRTAGGVFTGRQLAREGNKVTIMTDEGYRVTLYSDEIEAISEGPEKTIGIRRRGTVRPRYTRAYHERPADAHPAARRDPRARAVRPA